MLEDGEGRSPTRVPSCNPDYRFQLPFLADTVKVVIRAALEETRFRAVIGPWLRRMRRLLCWYSLFFNVAVAAVYMWGGGWYGSLTGPQPVTTTVVATTAASRAQRRRLWQSTWQHSCAFTCSEVEMMGTGGCTAVLPAYSHTCAVHVQRGTLLGSLTKLNGKCPTYSVQQCPPVQQEFLPGSIADLQHEKCSAFT